MKVNVTKFEQRLDPHSVVIFNPGMWAVKTNNHKEFKKAHWEYKIK